MRVDIFLNSLRPFLEYLWNSLFIRVERTDICEDMDYENMISSKDETKGDF